MLRRSSALDAYAMTAARYDGTSRQRHRHFSRTRGAGIATAENQIPWWPLPADGSVERVIEEGTRMMWDEGPGGGHYDNLTAPHHEVGCGVFVDDNRVTIVQAFR
jgi:hypothetical protein